MADNVSVTPGSGKDVSTEGVTTLNGASVSEVQVQRIGLGLITANSTAVDLPGDATNGLTVNLGANNDVTVTGTVTAQDGGGSITVDDGGSSLTVDGTVAVSGTVAVMDNAGSLTVDNAALSVVGGGTEATALRVTVASDSTGVLSVDDNGGSLTVDGTLALGAGSASIGTLGANNGVDIGDVTINNGSGASAVNVQDGGNSLTVDGTVAATQSGNWTARVADGAGNALTSKAPGSERALSVAIVDGSGAQVTSFGGSGGTSQTDDAAFTPGSGSFTPVGGIVTSDSVDSGDGGAFAMLANRQQKVTLYDSGGVELAVGGGTQYTEDAAAAANPVGNALIVVRDDARGGSLTTTDGDNIALRGTNAGELYVKHVDALTVNSHAVTNAGTFAVQVSSLPASTNTIEVVGDAAHDAAAAGNPVLVGAEFDDTTPDSVDEGDVGRLRISANRNLYSTIRDAAGNERGANVNASNQLSVSVDNTVTVASHAVTNAGTFVVQENGAALTALQLIDNLPNTIGSTTSGQSGVLSQGAVTTAAPTYTTAQTNPLSLQTDGSLRTAVTNTVTVGSHAVTNAGTFAVQVDGAALTALQLIDNLPNTLGSTTSGQSGALGLGAVTTAAPTYTTAQSNALSLQTDGSLRTAITNTVTVGSHAVTNAGTFAVQPSAATSGGWTPGKLISAGSTNATSVKASAGQVGYFQVTNINAAIRYLKIYNKASSPTVGTDTPVQTFGIPGSTAGAGFTLSFGPGMELTTGFAFALTTGAADADTGAVASGDIIVNYGYR